MKRVFETAECEEVRKCPVRLIRSKFSAAVLFITTRTRASEAIIGSTAFDGYVQLLVHQCDEQTDGRTE